MDADMKKVLHPFAVWGESFKLWGKNLLPLIALSAVSALLARIVKFSAPLWVPQPASALNIGLSVFFILEATAVLVAHAFLSLLIINHLKGYRSGRFVFSEAFDAAKNSLFYYIKTIFLLLVFVFFAANLAAFFLGLGEAIFRSPGGNPGINMAILISSATFFVVALLATIWYGFFYSLAPLVAAYEKKGPIAAIKESRRRMKGSALRYFSVLVLFAAGYVGLGVLAVKALTKLGASRFVINMVDPTMFTIFGPLWLAFWYLSYEKMTEIKK